MAISFQARSGTQELWIVPGQSVILTKNKQEQYREVRFVLHRGATHSVVK